MPSACGKRPCRNRGSVSSLPVADVPIEIREDVLDENLAAELFAEEADVAADDRPEVEQDRRPFARQRRSGTCGAPWWQRQDRRRPPTSAATVRRQVGAARGDRAGPSSKGSGEGSLWPSASTRDSRYAPTRCGGAAACGEAAPAAAPPPCASGLRRRLADRPCAACRRCRGSARLRRSPRAAR